eukprot:TRINITY_DN2254_c0_g1_i6.p2 TRINITY_DN2254_c0_g1~~TRINITY_DN2254_c0_g1_i6.p2  ORF type:complete len:255 (+),score=6.89 TRINITY_DN2254_c0_g1_i6:339-1103(+)
MHSMFTIRTVPITTPFRDNYHVQNSLCYHEKLKNNIQTIGIRSQLKDLRNQKHFLTGKPLNLSQGASVRYDETCNRIFISTFFYYSNNTSTNKRGEDKKYLVNLLNKKEELKHILLSDVTCEGGEKQGQIPKQNQDNASIHHPYNHTTTQTKFKTKENRIRAFLQTRTEQLFVDLQSSLIYLKVFQSVTYKKQLQKKEEDTLKERKTTFLQQYQKDNLKYCDRKKKGLAFKKTTYLPQKTIRTKSNNQIRKKAC